MIDLAHHVMTADNAPSPFVASASSNYSGYGPYHALDGGVGAGAYWISNGTSTGWWKIDFGSSVELNSYALQANTIPEPNRMPKNWTLQGSDNDTDWTTIDTQTDQTAWGSGEKRTFNLAANATYRYFKVDVTVNNGDAYLVLGEVYFYAPSETEISPDDMTADNAPSPYVVSLPVEHEIYPAYKAFNGDSSNPCINYGTTGALKIDLGAATACGGYGIEGGFDYPTRNPKSWTFEGSNDDSSWTTLDTQTDQSLSTPGVKKYNLSSSGNYRYYQLNVSANNGDANYLQINELHLYPPVVIDVEVNCSTDSLSLSTFGATVKLNVSVNVDCVSLLLTENQAFVEYPTNIQANVDVLSLTAQNAAVNINVGISTSAVSLVLQTFSADVDLDVSVQGDVASLILQTYQADVDIDVNVQAALASLALNPYAANINAEINVLADYDDLRLNTLHSMVTAPQSIFHYGDWRDYKGDRTWPDNFIEPSNKWGYLNNPRWQTSPQAKVSYTGNESAEPQVWSLPGGGYSSGTSKKHIPCGHWHKANAASQNYEGQVYICEQGNDLVTVWTTHGDFIRTIYGAGAGDFTEPLGVYVEDDEVYITQRYGSVAKGSIAVTDLLGTQTRNWYSVPCEPYFNALTQALQVRGYNGEIYVPRWDESRIEVYTPAGVLVRHFDTPADGTQMIDGQVQSGQWIAFYNGKLYVSYIFKVQVLNPLATGTQTPSKSWGSWGNGDGQFYGMGGIVVAENKVFVASSDPVLGYIHVFDLSGNFLYKFGTGGGVVYRGIAYYDGEIYTANSLEIDGMTGIEVWSVAGVKQRHWEWSLTGTLRGIYVYAKPV